MGKIFNRMFFVLALSALILVACQPNSQQQNIERERIDTAQIQATFDSLAAGFEAAVKAGDFDAQASIYAEDAIYSHPMMNPVKGRDSIRTVLQQVTPPGATADIQPIDTRIIAPDWVYEYGTVIFTFTPEGSDQSQKVSNTYFALFMRTDKGWKITRETLSSNHPLPASK